VPWTPSGGPITLENVTRVQALGRLDQPSESSTVMDYAMSPDSTRLVALTNVQMIIWDLVDGQVVFASGRSDTTQVFFSPDKTEVYGVGPTGETIVFDALTGALLNAFPGQTGYNGIAAYDRQNGWLALGSSDGSVRVWDTRERTALVTLSPHTTAISALEFSPDGERLLTAAADQTVQLWDWRLQERIHTWTTGETDAARLAYSPDSAFAAAGLLDGAVLWVIEDGAEIARYALPAQGASRILRFSPDGRYLLVGSGNAGLHLWGLGDAPAATLPEVGGNRLAARYDPSGSMLLTSAVGALPALWNLSQIGREALNRAGIDVGSDQIIDIAWTDDGRLLLFFDALGAIYVWGIAETG
jgi:WD40 repeat protein